MSQSFTILSYIVNLDHYEQARPLHRQIQGSNFAFSALLKAQYNRANHLYSVSIEAAKLQGQVKPRFMIAARIFEAALHDLQLTQQGLNALNRTGHVSLVIGTGTPAELQQPLNKGKLGNTKSQHRVLHWGRIVQLLAQHVVRGEFWAASNGSTPC